MISEPILLGITSFKGGVGKTTTAMHLAAGLSAFAPTLLVDDDRNKSARVWAAACSENDRPLPFKVVSSFQLALHAARHKIIILDGAAGASPEQMKEMVEAVTLLIIPTFPDLLSLTSLAETVKLARSVRSDLLLRILLARVPAQTNAKDGNIREGLTGLPVFATHIEERRVFSRAPLYGGLVSQLKERDFSGATAAARNYADLTAEVAALLGLGLEKKAEKMEAANGK